MTRTSVYSAALVVFSAATAMAIASIMIPNWVSYSASASSGSRYWKTLGLHRSCSSGTLSAPGSGRGRDGIDVHECHPFPTDDLCAEGSERAFCHMWRSVGFLASFATILHLATLVTFLVVIGGGKMKRESGWRLLGGFLLSVAAVEFAGVGIVAYLFDHDDQFVVPGWYLDSAWYLEVASASLATLCAVGLALSAYILPPENGYEFLRDPIGA